MPVKTQSERRGIGASKGMNKSLFVHPLFSVYQFECIEPELGSFATGEIITIGR